MFWNKAESGSLNILCSSLSLSSMRLTHELKTVQNVRKTRLWLWTKCNCVWWVSWVAMALISVTHACRICSMFASTGRDMRKTHRIFPPPNKRCAESRAVSASTRVRGPVPRCNPAQRPKEKERRDRLAMINVCKGRLLCALSWLIFRADDLRIVPLCLFFLFFFSFFFFFSYGSRLNYMHAGLKWKYSNPFSIFYFQLTFPSDRQTDRQTDGKVFLKISWSHVCCWLLCMFSSFHELKRVSRFLGGSAAFPWF